MLIAATSSSTGPMILNPAQITPIKTQTTASSTKLPASFSTATSSPAASSAPTASAPAISSSGGHGHVSGGGASASAAAEVESLAGTYTTTVGGTQYSGSVEEEMAPTQPLCLTLAEPQPLGPHCWTRKTT